MRIGETFKKAGIITSEELNVALQDQKKTHDRLGDIVLRMGFATPESFAPALANYFHIPFINLKEFYKSLKPEVVDRIPQELAIRFHTIPIDLKDNTLIVATFDPLNLLAIDTLRIKTGYKIECVVASENDIQEAIEYCYNNLPRLRESIADFIHNEVVDDISETLDEEDHGSSKYAASDQPVVQFVRSLVVQAVNSRASDILIQPKQDKADLRFRVDGILHNIDPPPKAMLPAITTRIKILASLDIAEKRLPQDGRFRIKIGSAEVDIRTSCFPTIYGESVVLRLLETSAPLVGINQLGFYPEDLHKFEHLLQHSYGLVLVTGPTGSGKTTTLYTALNELKTSEKNIITLEDPVEYRLPFIQQSQVNSNIGFTFARGLRSILRQDPDVIMVGEIRDQETAEIAIHAALTGHLVFATLHTNDAAGAAVRMVKMGVEPYLITSSLLGVIGQRLIRTVCSECRESTSMEPALAERLGFTGDTAAMVRGRGCGKCLGSGYLGRQGIYEVLVPDENIRKLILNQESSEQIRLAAQQAGMKTLRQIGLDKLRQGVTTPEEILRVTQETEDI